MKSFEYFTQENKYGIYIQKMGWDFVLIEYEVSNTWGNVRYWKLQKQNKEFKHELYIKIFWIWK